MSSILSSILSSTSSTNQITITNATTGAIVASGVKIRSVKIHLNSQLQKHMREDGATLTDERVIHGTAISMDVFCPTLNDVNTVIQIMNDRQNLYTIVAKGLTFANMMAMATQNKQTPEVLSAAPFTIMFMEQLLENVAPVICSQAADSDTQDNGLQQLTSIGNNVNNFLTTVRNNAATAASSISGFFGG
jgi:hypothetical protein